jgi:hypothetical protein
MSFARERRKIGEGILKGQLVGALLQPDFEFV